MRHEIGKDNYIVGTIVTFKGDPVLIREVSGKHYIAEPLEVERNIVINKGDRGLNVTSIELGYMNLFNPNGYRALYVLRRPSRQWKQGLNSDLLCYLDSKANLINGLNLLDYRQEAASMLRGSYLSLPDAMYHVNNGPSATDTVAFSRTFAINKGGNLLYKQRCIGKIDKKLKITLEDVFSYMSELVEEEIERAR